MAMQQTLLLVSMIRARDQPQRWVDHDHHHQHAPNPFESDYLLEILGVWKKCWVFEKENEHVLMNQEKTCMEKYRRGMEKESGIAVSTSPTFRME